MDAADFRARILALLSTAGVDATALLEVPPDPRLGDYALPCFSFAKERKKAPAAIAQELAGALQADFLERTEAIGPYVNFFIAPTARAKAVLGAPKESLWRFGGGKEKVLIEYPSPNTNKPLHLGHVRNMVLGSTLSTVLQRAGNTVIQVNLNNDRGVHICKSMLAYERWGNGATPESTEKKSDHFVGEYYVLFEKKKQEDSSLEAEAQAMLVRWEQGEQQVRALWEKMNAWALKGFEQTYNRYHIRFDKQYYESDIYHEGKEIVLRNKDVFERDSETGAYVAKLGQFGLPDKVVLRSDGTAIYMTQDIALTLRKIEDFGPDTQVWVVANEQNLHFQQLFAILGLLGVRKQFHHLSYGMVALPEGRMKSREGRVVDADDILDELEGLAAAAVRENNPGWPAEKAERIGKAIALGAIRFFMVKFDPAKDFTFNPQSSLSFEGDSGPYLQYTHARICSILAKAEPPGQCDPSLLLAVEEQALLRELSTVGETFLDAVRTYRPNLVAAHLLEIARTFNTFYHACPVLQAEPALRDARLHLLVAVRDMLETGLSLLGIEAPGEM